MKVLRLMATCGVLFSLVCACVERIPEPKAPKTPIMFLHYFSGSLQGGVDDMARAFNARSTGFDLRPAPLDHEAFKTSIRTTLAQGSPPDIYSYWAGARTASLVEHLEPIDDIWQAHHLEQRFAPHVVRSAVEYGGKKYLIPLTQHYVGFFYNRKLFERLKLEPPADWPGFLQVCRKLKQHGIMPVALGAKEKWPAQFWFDYLLLRTAPLAFREQLLQGQASYADPRVGRVFRLWQELLTSGFINRDSNQLAWDTGANEMVYAGKAGMTLMGSWIIGQYGDTAHSWQPGVDYDFFPFPVIDPAIPRVALGPVDGLVVPKRALNKAGAKEVIAYLAEMAPQQAFSRGSGAIAPNIGVPREFYSGMQQRILDDINRSSAFTFNYDLSTPPELAELGLNAFIEFLAFPKEYPAIQKKLAADSTRLYRSRENAPR